MKNIDRVQNLVNENAGLAKKELVELVAKTINVSIPNARVYIYNVQKRSEKKAQKKSAVTKTVKAAAELGVSA